MVIFAGLLKFNIQMAVCILLAVVLASVSLLQQLFYLKYPPESQAPLRRLPANAASKTFRSGSLPSCC